MSKVTKQISDVIGKLWIILLLLLAQRECGKGWKQEWCGVGKQRWGKGGCALQMSPKVWEGIKAHG